MAKILMVTHSPSPDLRIDREAKALIKAGHKVFLIHRSTKGSIPDFYEKTFDIPLNLRQRALLPLASRIASRKYKKVIEEVNPEIIHAHDITAANIVRFVLPKATLFIYDDHEIWEYLRIRQFQVTKNILKKGIVLFVYFITKIINKKLSKLADLLVVINNHWVKYYAKKGINPHKIISIENFASKNLYKEVKRSNVPIDDFFIKDQRKKIIHSSKLKLSTKVVRDVSNFATAANELDDWVMVVFGEADPEFEKYGVKFIPRKPRMEYLASCLRCDVALNTLILDERFHYSSSNRLYEFLILGLRVISSRAQTYVDKFDDKLIWADTTTPKGEIINILQNIDSYPSGDELKQLVKEKYNWEDEIQKLVTKYQQLLENNVN